MYDGGDDMSLWKGFGFGSVVGCVEGRLPINRTNQPQPTPHRNTNQHKVAFEFAGLLLRSLHPLDAQGQPTYREGEPPRDPDVAAAAHTLALDVSEKGGRW